MLATPPPLPPTVSHRLILYVSPGTKGHGLLVDHSGVSLKCSRP